MAAAAGAELSIGFWTMMSKRAEPYDVSDAHGDGSGQTEQQAQAESYDPHTPSTRETEEGKGERLLRLFPE